MLLLMLFVLLSSGLAIWKTCACLFLGKQRFCIQLFYLFRLFNYVFFRPGTTWGGLIPKRAGSYLNRPNLNRPNPNRPNLNRPNLNRPNPNRSSPTPAGSPVSIGNPLDLFHSELKRKKNRDDG
jgi:hypothetical protein